MFLFFTDAMALLITSHLPLFSKVGLRCILELLECRASASTWRVRIEAGIQHVVLAVATKQKYRLRLDILF